jgi:choline dehydrogenase-like flavoprotein
MEYFGTFRTQFTLTLDLSQVHHQRPFSEHTLTSQRRFKPSETVDFVVVGSGAAGGVIARELSQAGFSVVVLEQGPRLGAGDFQHDDLKYNYLSGITNDPAQSPQTFRDDPAVVAQRPSMGNSLIYARIVGGSSAHFTANFWRFHPNDFNERSLLGAIPGTGFADWPITYEELEPYYTQVDWQIGVSGLADASPFDPPRSKPYPLPPLPVKSSGVLMERGARKLGWHPFPAPMAILSQPYRGRPGCAHCGFCIGFGCEVMAKSSTLYTMIPEAEATGRCEIRPHSYVYQVALHKNGRASGVHYYDEMKHDQFQKARAVVLAANGAETPRLLLNSASDRFPQGLANSSGLVGKYLMFNQGSGVHAQFEHELNEYKSVQVTRILHDFYDADPKRGFYGGGGIDARMGSQPVGWAMASGGELPRWGMAYKERLEAFPRSMLTSGHCTSLAVERNNVSIDPTLKDAWGIPAIRVTYKDHPDDLATAKFLQDRSLEIMQAAGAQKTWRAGQRIAQGSVHLLGTCRMGNDPATSVVDKYHRAHDVANLFICDGSSFVTSGRGQPTMTIQALAFRAADYLGRFAKRGDI